MLNGAVHEQGRDPTSRLEFHWPRANGRKVTPIGAAIEPARGLPLRTALESCRHLVDNAAQQTRSMEEHLEVIEGLVADMEAQLRDVTQTAETYRLRAEAAEMELQSLGYVRSTARPSHPKPVLRRLGLRRR